MKKQIHQDVYIGIVALVFCVVVLFLNTGLNGGAGTMPLLLDALLAIFSVVILINGIKKSNLSNEKQEKKFLTIDVLKYPFLAWCLVGAYVLLFYLTGYIISTAIMVLVLMFFMKQRNWKTMIAIVAVYLILVYVVFIRLLSVNVGGFGLLGRLL